MTSISETSSTPQEQLEQARKKFSSDYKPDQNMAQVYVNIPWQYALVLPYEDALKLMASLERAELLTSKTYGSDVVTSHPLGKEEIKMSLMSKQAYTNIKVAELLGLSHEQLNKLNTGEDLNNDS